ncbi:MAG: pyruvate kinase [Acidobacteriota bacterium]
MHLRNTKIVATLGPASGTPEILRAMVEAGMNVARLNFSHGKHEDHLGRIRMLRQVSKETGKVLAVLQDLSGPKLRIGELPDGPAPLTTGAEVILSARLEKGSAERLPIASCPWLPQEVQEGQRIFLNDGLIQLKVRSTRVEEVVCEVVAGGTISSHKGINLPDTHLRQLQIPTEKDQVDLQFGLQHEVDYVALSFVRTAEDVRNLRELIQRAGSKARIIAKIEKNEALTNIEAIVAETDGVMVARGDLGVETDLEMVTLKQKEIISRCNDGGKVVITATQMLESMIQNPTPTRAEVSDITNAIFDGTDAVMLSGETAVGRFPVESVRVMAKVANKAEEVFDSENFLKRRALAESASSAAVAHAACLLAKELSAAAIIANTESGHTALMVSRFRPGTPVLGMSRNETTVRQLALVWGVHPTLMPSISSTDELVDQSLGIARRSGLVKPGDRVVITAGVPVGQAGSTNLIEVITA